MWLGLFCNLVFLVRQRGEVQLGPSRIHRPTSLRWKVGMTAFALSYPRCFNAAEACPANGRSHVICTLISRAVLERVDVYAKDVARQQKPTPGWTAGLQKPTVCFIDESMPRPYQVHDPQPLFRHRLCRYLKGAVSLPPVRDDPRYTFYSDPVMKGFLTWGVHLMVVAIRHDVGTAPGGVCPFCGATPSMRHYVEGCRIAPLLLLPAMGSFGCYWT